MPLYVCNYDGGDCCLTSPNTDYCSECTCHHQQTCLAGVHPLSLHGDGYCHDELNNLECTYDGGDCCPNIIFGYNPLVGNGFCNDDTNIAECDYDGGDCCGYSINSEHCTECTCFHQETCLAGVTHGFVGDGVCNDETNIAECNYDGGDCCLMNVNTDSCSDCNCLASGVITSPGFPGNYDNNLDLTWLIQVQMGQMIEINFLSFDVEYDSSCW